MYIHKHTWHSEKIITPFWVTLRHVNGLKLPEDCLNSNALFILENKTVGFSNKLTVTLNNKGIKLLLIIFHAIVSEIIPLRVWPSRNTKWDNCRAIYKHLAAYLNEKEHTNSFANCKKIGSFIAHVMATNRDRKDLTKRVFTYFGFKFSIFLCNGQLFLFCFGWQGDKKIKFRI